MNFHNLLAGFIVGVIVFFANILVQYFLSGFIDFFIAGITAFVLFVVFTIITAKFKQ